MCEQLSTGAEDLNHGQSLHLHPYLVSVRREGFGKTSQMYRLDWLQSLKQFFINVSYHIFVASLTLMALF